MQKYTEFEYTTTKNEKISQIIISLSAFANDFDADAQVCYNSNPLLTNDGAQCLLEDIRNVDANQIPNFDVLLAGFPCQPFSNAGNRKGVNDANGRGTLFEECERIIRAKIENGHRPQAFVFENVRGILSSKMSDGVTTVPQEISNRMRDMGYDWYSELISILLAGCSEEKVFALTKQFESDGISIPQNLIVVGTVNMDETTFSFSRKVLDRAMTIEMNEVDLTGGLTNRYEQIGKLGMNELVGKAVEGVDVYENYEGVCNIAITYLKSINDVLEGTPFKVAYRTRNEVLLYVVNNLPYNKNAEGEELLEEYVIARALDEITNMKVLSRIEGDETKVNNAFLEKLEKAIKQGLEDIFEGLFEKEETDDAFKSVSLAKLDEMKKRLSSGYTSFWS